MNHLIGLAFGLLCLAAAAVSVVGVFKPKGWWALGAWGISILMQLDLSPNGRAFKVASIATALLLLVMGVTAIAFYLTHPS